MGIPKPKKSSQSVAYWHSKKQETTTASTWGGRTTSASGSKVEKGDVRVRGLVRGESKCTGKRSFSVKLSDIIKLEEASMQGGTEVPVMDVEFVNEKGKVVAAVCVVPRWAIDTLIENQKP